MVDRRKSQRYNFAFEAIPTMFHSQSRDFIHYLDRDGLKFLRFWWDYVGDRLPKEMCSPFIGLDYKIIKIDEQTTLVILTLPDPLEEGEAYFIALIGRPERRFAWVKLPTSRVIALLRRSGEDFVKGTEIGDITVRGRFVSLGPGPSPNEESFTKVAIKIASKRSS